MSYLLVENLNKSFNDRVILNRVSFSIDLGDKVALVAKNGTGKSTFLKILMGKEGYDSGKITMQKGVKLAFLPQEPELDLNRTIQEEIFDSESPTIIAVKEYKESMLDLENTEKMQNAYEAMNKYNAWEYEEKIQTILKNLKIDHLDQKIETFSGGQKKRLALAKILIDIPDFLIMDEPTNHLDLEMIDWLEEYLQEQDITLLLVTHDRYFLERVTNEIIELENGTFYKYKGNYSYYLENKTIRQANENTNIDRTNALLKKELQWVIKAPRGRQAKSTARVGAYHELKGNLKEKNQIEKVKLDVVGRRLGGKILEIHNLNKSFGNIKIVKNFNYSFTKGEKVGIVGENGVGKTSFLNLIMGIEPFDSGKIIPGETVHFGYYSQTLSDLKEDDKVIDSLKKIANYIKLSDGTEISASQMLERFLFSPKVQQNTVSKLSGGEKRKLNLLKILMDNPNFLILDEPTNDLDIMTLNVLEEFLHEFKGCLIIISHDRYFMDKIVDHLFVFKGDGVVKDFPGNYSEYRDSVEAGEEIADAGEDLPVKTDPKSKNINEAHELFIEIGKLEKKRDTLAVKAYETGLSYQDIIKYSKELKDLNKEIEVKSERWLELSSI